MPKVALIINDPCSARSKIVSLLRTHLKLDLAGALNAIDRKEVVFERQLFPRDDPSFPERLLVALSELDKLGIDYTAFELLDHQTFIETRRDALYQLTAERLRNLIATRKKSLEEIQRRARLEEGIE